MINQEKRHTGIRWTLALETMMEKTSIEVQFRISNKRNNYVSMSGTYKRNEREKKPLMKTEWTPVVETEGSTSRESPYTGIRKL